ncbi:DUF4189 domain-containing protein [Pseudorhizobium sp. NPDC055634]
MTNIKKAGLAAVVGALALVMTNTSAHAWGCIAVSDEGSYGYSYGASSESAAMKRALNECAARTSTEGECEITECEEDD